MRISRQTDSFGRNDARRARGYVQMEVDAVRAK
jgi:hypothetical protein